MKNLIKWLLETFSPEHNKLWSKSIRKEKARKEFDAKCQERYTNKWRLK